MSYFFRLVLFLSNVMLFCGSVILCLYSLIMILVEPDEWTFRLALLGVGMAGGIISLVLYVVRKNKVPVPGIDYR